MTQKSTEITPGAENVIKALVNGEKPKAFGMGLVKAKDKLRELRLLLKSGKPSKKAHEMYFVPKEAVVPKGSQPVYEKDTEQIVGYHHQDKQYEALLACFVFGPDHRATYLKSTSGAAIATRIIRKAYEAIALRETA